MQLLWVLAQVNEQVVDGARWPLFLAIALALGFCFATLVFLGKDNGVAPDEVALGYEYAWDRLDFAAIWAMSTPDMRQGRGRDTFVADKKRAIPPTHVKGTLSHVSLEAAKRERHRVLYNTTLHLVDGSTFQNEILVVRNPGSWLVAEYHTQMPGLGGDGASAGEIQQTASAPQDPSVRPPTGTNVATVESPASGGDGAEPKGTLAGPEPLQQA
jgi:hypothetical protein